MGRCNDNSKAVDLQKEQSIHPRQQGGYSKTRTISSIIPHTLHRRISHRGRQITTKLAAIELCRSQPKSNQHIC